MQIYAKKKIPDIKAGILHYKGLYHFIAIRRIKLLEPERTWTR